MGAMSSPKGLMEAFLPLQRTAVRLGVPAAWLRAEARAGRVPHLRVGRRLLVNPEDVERVLLERSRQGEGGKGSMIRNATTDPNSRPATPPRRHNAGGAGGDSPQSPKGHPNTAISSKTTVSALAGNE